MRLIRPWLGQFPIGGTFVFVGVYFRIGHWYKAALPRRTILIYNTLQPDRLEKALQRLRAWHRAPVEIVYTSRLLRALSDRPGIVIESPIDLARFIPTRRPLQDRFRVGRLSRDIASKHHEDDPALSTRRSRPTGSTCGSWEAVPPWQGHRARRRRAAACRRRRPRPTFCRVSTASAIAPATAGSRPTVASCSKRWPAVCPSCVDGAAATPTTSFTASTASCSTPPTEAVALIRNLRHDPGIARARRPRCPRNRGAALRRCRLAAQAGVFPGSPPTRDRAARPVRQLVRSDAVPVGLTRSRPPSVPSDHAHADIRQAVDVAFHHVADDDRTDVLRRARVDDVAGRELERL